MGLKKTTKGQKKRGRIAVVAPEVRGGGWRVEKHGTGLENWGEECREKGLK